MKKMSRVPAFRIQVRIVTLLMFFLSVILLPGGIAAAFEAVVLKSLPEDYKDLEAQLHSREASKNAELILAKGEGEPFLIAIFGFKEKAFSVRTKGLPEADWIKFTVHRAGWIDIGLPGKTPYRKADPLFPITLGETVTSPDDICVLWARLAIGNTTPSSADLQFSVQLSSGGESTEIPVRARIAPITLPSDIPLTIQASLAIPDKVKRGTDSISEIVGYYSFLNEYGINAASWGGQEHFYDKEFVFYHELFVKARMKKVLLPLGPKTIVGDSRDPQTLAAKLAELKDSTKMTLEKFRPIIEKYPDAFLVRLWDEPKEKDYPVVRELCSYLADSHLPVLTEITALPRAEIMNCVSAFVPYLEHMDIETIRQAQKNGKQVWFYANAMHSVRNPYHTMRNIGWIASSLGLEGYYFWCMNCGYGGDPYTILHGKIDNAARGYFLYPGTSSKAFNPSIRLEMFRKGLEDYMIVREAGKLQNLSCVRRKIDDYLSDKYRLRPKADRYLNDPKAMHDQLLEMIKKGSC